MKPALFAAAFFLCLNLQAQDSLYTRKVIKDLTSKKCYGRGYIKNGLRNAEKYIVKEIEGQLRPLFDSKFTQAFYHSVNTFPSGCKVTLNGKKLVPGQDFIPDPSSQGACGTFKLKKIDSTTFSTDNSPRLTVLLKKKLTYSVGRTPGEYCKLELEASRFTEEPNEIKINLKNEIVSDFESRNIGGFIDGSTNADSMIVFTAHYDHLGGIGKSTYFPGANDNASGVSVLLNLIKHYKKNPPKYKTVFIFFAGEEAGLLGSKYLVANQSLELKKIKFLINLDLLGTGDEGIMVVNGAVHEKEFEKLTKLNDEKKLAAGIKKRGKAANSDHYWFSEAGVPCFFIYTMGGTTSYHDVYDIEKNLPLTDYKDIFSLLVNFVALL